MSLTQEEAAEALKALERTEARSAEVFNGRMMSPHLILWGLIWVVGYGTIAIRPEWAVVWTALIPVGVIASTAIGVLGSRARRGGGMLFSLGILLATALFLVAVNLVTGPLSGAQTGAFIPLVVGLVYALYGLAPGMRRLFFSGIALSGLTIGGFFFLREHFALWMAAVGGGGLVAGGLWLRSI
jgi:hypothetical protein